MDINAVGFGISITFVVISIIRVVKKYYKPSKWELLHLIKQKFIYYKSPKGNWILMDVKTKKVIVIDNDLVTEFMKPHLIEDYDDTKFRYLKLKLTEKFCDNYLNKIKYKQALRIYQKKLNGTNS